MSRPFRVLLSAGHGGKDSGAESVCTAIPEKDYNLDFALRVGEMLAENDIWAMQVRSTDFKVPLDERVRMADALKPDLFLSIHCNAFHEESANGCVAFYRDHGADIAEYLLFHLNANLGLRHRGAKHDIRDLGKKLKVLNANNRTHPCLLEVGFITNRADVQTFSNVENVAEAIVAGILAWKGR